MLKQEFLKIDKYYVLPIFVGIGQFTGFNIYFAILILAAISLILTYKIDYQSIVENKYLFLFGVFSTIISLINLTQQIPDFYSILVWGQFFFIAFIPIFINDSGKLLKTFMKIVLILFALDLSANLIVLAGLKIPGIIEAAPRPGEIFPRMAGIMNSNLFSSSISFLALCFFLDQNTLKEYKRIKIGALILIFFNIFLAGANRTFIISIAVLLVKLFPSLRKSVFKNIGLVFAVVGSVIILTFSAALRNASNILRSQMWLISVDKIFQKPLMGFGIYFPDGSKALANMESLSEMVVTESFMLAIAYSFGLICLLLFLFFVFDSLARARSNLNFTFQYGIFLGISIELFFGGTLSNTLSAFIYFLSAYTLIVKNIYALNITYEE